MGYPLVIVCLDQHLLDVHLTDASEDEAALVARRGDWSLWTPIRRRPTMLPVHTRPMRNIVPNLVYSALRRRSAQSGTGFPAD